MERVHLVIIGAGTDLRVAAPSVKRSEAKLCRMARPDYGEDIP